MKKVSKYSLPFIVVLGIFGFASCANEEEDNPKKTTEEVYFEGVATTFEGEEFKSTTEQDFIERIGSL